MSLLSAALLHTDRHLIFASAPKARKSHEKGWRDLLNTCLGSNGAPPMQPNPEGNYYQFVQTPDTTVILSEVSHDARMVRMNSMHSPAAITS